MTFNEGDRVKGKYYEFKDIEGTVIRQVNQGVVLVSFDNCPITVATIVDNLKLIKKRLLA